MQTFQMMNLCCQLGPVYTMLMSGGLGNLGGAGGLGGLCSLSMYGFSGLDLGGLNLPLLCLLSGGMGTGSGGAASLPLIAFSSKPQPVG